MDLVKSCNEKDGVEVNASQSMIRESRQCERSLVLNS